MKKLMIAFGMVATAISSYAASFDWKTSAVGKIYTVGSATDLYTGTAYIFDSGSYSQQTVLTAFLTSGIDFSKALDSKSVTSGKITATVGEAFDWGTAGDTLNAYVVVIDGDNAFISSIVSGEAPAISYKQLNFDLKNDSQSVAFSTGTFSSGGWYSTGSVPEPTSGLLMLIGMAGLALRRRRV